MAPFRQMWPFLTVGVSQPSKKARPVEGLPEVWQRCDPYPGPLGKTSGRGLPEKCGRGPGGEGLPEDLGEDLRKTFQKVWKR